MVAREGFLDRWSRLKRDGTGVEEGSGDDAAATPVHAETSPDNATASKDQPEGRVPDDDLSDADLLARYELPDPATLAPGADFSAFMRQAVPARLQRMALRVLYRSNPVLANLDGMIDYGEDFTDAATVVENMATVYEVGRGAAWKHIAAMEAKAAEEAAEAEAAVAEEEPPVVDDAPPEAPPVAEAAPDALPEPDAEPFAMAEAAPEPYPLPRRPRPMRFSFD